MYKRIVEPESHPCLCRQPIALTNDFVLAGIPLIFEWSDAEISDVHVQWKILN